MTTHASSQVPVEFTLAITETVEHAQAELQLSDTDNIAPIAVSWHAHDASVSIATQETTITLPLVAQTTIPVADALSGRGIMADAITTLTFF